MFDGRWRTAVDRTTGPVGETLHRHGITADVLTATGLVSASATAVLVASGHFHLAILFLIITGMHDLFDGPVAKAAGTASVRGAFFDSVTDRDRRRRPHVRLRVVPAGPTGTATSRSCPWRSWR